MTELQDHHASSRPAAPSAVRRDQRATLEGLGLNKIGRQSTLEDTPAVRGMIAKVAHLVRVVDGSEDDAMKLNESKTTKASPRRACASAAASARARASSRAAAARARPRAPACASRASRAARCRCIAACRSAASTRPSPSDLNEVNLGRVQTAIDAGKLDAGQPVTVEALIEAGVCARARDGVKILGKGELKAKLCVSRSRRVARARSRRSRRPAAASRRWRRGARSRRLRPERRVGTGASTFAVGFRPYD